MFKSIPKIVKFKDGTYAIRKGNPFIGYKFLDLSDLSMWWYSDSIYFLGHRNGCITTDLEKLKNILNGSTDLGEEVK